MSHHCIFCIYAMMSLYNLYSYLYTVFYYWHFLRSQSFIYSFRHWTSNYLSNLVFSCLQMSSPSSSIIYLASASDESSFYFRLASVLLIITWRYFLPSNTTAQNTTKIKIVIIARKGLNFLIYVYTPKPVSYTHLTLPTIYSV